MLGVGLASACGPVPAIVGGDETAMATTTSGSEPPLPSHTTQPPSDATDSGSPSDPDTTTDGGMTDDAGFIVRGDWPHGSSFECDTFAQDCPRGQKCTVWANDGGPGWNATRCFDIAVDAVGPGEACTMQRSATSGLDNCDATSMCWAVDEMLQGTCTTFCQGSEDAPICPEDTFCSGGRVLALCLARCDPLQQDCPVGSGCYPLAGEFGCVPTDAPRGAGHGTPCEFINGCEPGSICIGADAHTACASPIGCCAMLCDYVDPLSDMACAALDSGQSCQAWFVEGMEPMRYGTVGVCATPL
jgi:hypothetical protein